MADLCESLLTVTSANRRVIDVGNYSDQKYGHHSIKRWRRIQKPGCAKLKGRYTVPPQDDHPSAMKRSLIGGGDDDDKPRSPTSDKGRREGDPDIGTASLIFQALHGASCTSFCFHRP